MKVLFVCAENTGRSPMAEYIFNNLSREMGKDNIAKSVGVTAHGDYPSENALIVMAKNDIDMTKHISKQITREDIDWADLVLTMGKTHLELIKQYIPNDKTFTIYDYIERKDKDVQDPYCSNIEVYEETRKELEDLMKKLLNIL